LSGLGAGQCNAFAPQGWRVAAHAPDNSLFHVMAQESFAQDPDHKKAVTEISKVVTLISRELVVDLDL